MSQYSRRDFLTHSAAGALVLASHGILTNAAFAAEPAEMAIAKWSGPKDLDPEQLKEAAVKLTENAIQAIGGLKRFVSKGSVVWIKPNIAWDSKPETAANTNPDVVATLIRLCFDAGAKTVKVGDNPCSPVAAKTYASSGISAAAKPLGAEVVFLDRSRFKDTEIKGQRIKSIPIYPDILDCDLVINVPVIKHHKMSELTMCMKNYMGVIEKRRTFHQDMPTCLADITRFMKPRISVLDAVRVLKAHGPQGGNLADVELKLAVAAGTDVVALDAWGAEIMGRKPTDIPSVKKGAETGLGKIDYKSFAKEIAVS
ncbi:MAG: DUF362 domain-containing protein [Thermoguttaceae bacterium]|jgi:uncharacterized protein (DUF362 family)